jgi:glycine oxidase
MRDLAMIAFRTNTDIWDDLRAQTGESFGAGAVARIHLAMDQVDMDWCDEQACLYEATPGFSSRWLTGSEARTLIPSLGRDVLGGLWTTGNLRVDAREYTACVVSACSVEGVRLVAARVTGLSVKGERVSAVICDGDKFECDHVVIAAGPWCKEICSWIGLDLPVFPVRGELLRIETPRDASGLDVTWRTWGLYHARDGGAWLGGTEDDGGDDSTPSTDGPGRIMEGVTRMLPGLPAPRVIGHVAGFRPTTPDGFPIIDRLRSPSNVCVATGGGRKGMLMGAALGLAAADLVTEGSTPIPIGSCRFDRFGRP